MNTKDKIPNEAHSEPLQQYKVRRSSKCPFCGGSKIKPFMGFGKSQNCKECNKDGFISNSKLRRMGLEDFVEKNFA